MIGAEAKQPEEDISKASCTLFEPVKVEGEEGRFYLKHVVSGGRLLIDQTSWEFYLDMNPFDGYGYLTFVDCESLVRLPAHVGFKGANGLYLKSYMSERGSCLQFGSNDVNDIISSYTVWMMPDGHVRIRSDDFGKFWWVVEELELVYGDWSEDRGYYNATLFWPVKIDGNTKALRSANGKFCNRFSLDGNPDYLGASVDSITREAKLQVEDLVLERKIYYVRYRMEDSRIFGETPFLAGTARLSNTRDEVNSMAVSITYQDSKSYSFSRGVSVTGGVKTSIKAGLPFIVDAQIEVSLELSGEFTWDTTTTTTTSVTATGTVPVPAKSSVVVEYVGTRGTCNIPFSYTQEDTNSTDGQVVRADHDDGIYQGVSYYNFQFNVRSSTKLI